MCQHRSRVSTSITRVNIEHVCQHRSRVSTSITCVNIDHVCQHDAMFLLLSFVFSFQTAVVVVCIGHRLSCCHRAASILASAQLHQPTKGIFARQRLSWHPAQRATEGIFGLIMPYTRCTYLAVFNKRPMGGLRASGDFRRRRRKDGGEDSGGGEIEKVREQERNKDRETGRQGHRTGTARRERILSRCGWVVAACNPMLWEFELMIGGWWRYRRSKNEGRKGRTKKQKREEEEEGGLGSRCFGNHKLRQSLRRRRLANDHVSAATRSASQCGLQNFICPSQCLLTTLYVSVTEYKWRTTASIRGRFQLLRLLHPMPQMRGSFIDAHGESISDRFRGHFVL